MNSLLAPAVRGPIAKGNWRCVRRKCAQVDDTRAVRNVILDTTYGVRNVIYDITYGVRNVISDITYGRLNIYSVSIFTIMKVLAARSIYRSDR